MIAKYLIIKNPENILPADEIIAEINNQAVPILWVGSEGRFRLIPKEIVQNLLDLHEALQQAKDSEYKSPPLQIVWSQGIEINNEIGRILLDE